MTWKRLCHSAFRLRHSCHLCKWQKWHSWNKYHDRFRFQCYLPLL